MTIPSELYYSSFPTGSNYICNPPVTNTDIDVAYYVKDLYNTACVLKEQGWVDCGTDEYGYEGWAAFRKGVDNAICFASFDDYIRFEAATELAKKKNLLDKEERVELFTIICPRATKTKVVKEVARTQERVAQEERDVVNIATRALEAYPQVPHWRVDENQLRDLLMQDARNAVRRTAAQLHPNDVHMRGLRGENWNR